jgi:hypothetical protein
MKGRFAGGVLGDRVGPEIVVKGIVLVSDHNHMPDRCRCRNRSAIGLRSSLLSNRQGGAEELTAQDQRPDLGQIFASGDLRCLEGSDETAWGGSAKDASPRLLQVREPA